MPLGIFGFRALWSPYFLTAIILMTVLFFLLTTKWRKEFKNSEPLKRKEAILFIIAMILLYVIKGSPVDLMAHILFSVHMIQMATLFFIFTPILIIAIPPWLWEHIIKLPVIKQMYRFFTKPIIAVATFSILFSFYHIPIIFDTIKMNFLLHASYTFLLFVGSLFMWWPLINKLPGQPQLHGLKKAGYLILDAVLITPACALIIFANNPVYGTYADASLWLQSMALCVPTSTLSGLTLSGPELFTNMPVLEDQQLGGVLMKIIQEIVLIIVLFRVFSQWFRKEQEEGEKITETHAKLVSNSTNPTK